MALGKFDSKEVVAAAEPVTEASVPVDAEKVALKGQLDDLNARIRNFIATVLQSMENAGQCMPAYTFVSKGLQLEVMMQSCAHGFVNMDFFRPVQKGKGING